MVQIDEITRKKLLKFQVNEITEYHIYAKLSALTKDAHNASVLKNISGDELRHYGEWKKITGVEVRPDRMKYFFYVIVSTIFGVTFGIKLMEGGEGGAQTAYGKITTQIPEAEAILKDEQKHEKSLIAMIDEEKLKYVGSMVLGLNDALVELTGTLAGLTFALQNTRIVGMAGLITGIAAALSMAASEYLSKKSDAGEKDPVKASFYTGMVYIFAVVLLVLPYFIFHSFIFALLATLIVVVVLIYVFTFYISVVKEISFKERFLEMLFVSFGVAFLSFIIGLLVRQFLGISM